ncbi:MAG: histidine phosphatase family protein [Bacteroidota bacterium]|nr:histidine phosphatase family protein [Bacteroidota bacterium]MDX5430776.1 histidine phosphatase family protein [Bacteroidota bacterium]MDX5469521.1 histidine phosphatase family protein [Bacteroidota bacterium]
MNGVSQSSSKPHKKTIYLIRHGETEFNRLGIVQGSGVDSDLNETGRHQAERFYQQYGGHPFDRVYTSALRRTHQSVANFLDKGIPHTILPELNEISWGDYEGKESKDFWKEDYHHMVDAWRSGQLDYRIPGGESPLELQARQKIALQHILSRPHEEQVLVCMHGRAMKSFLCLMLDLPLTQMDDFVHHNLGLYLLEFKQDQFRLLKTNSTEHL